MYNGIGLSTPRGSGTSGYVTGNKFNLRQNNFQKNEDRRESDGPKEKKPNEEILLHNQKREIEVKLYELRTKLEDDDELPAEEIEQMLAKERAVLERNFVKEKEISKAPVQETHEVARRKMEQMERIRKALGIRKEVKEEGFDSEMQERRRKDTKVKSGEMEHERRHIEKDDKRRREVDDEKPRTERKEERRKSRERSFERERSPTQRDGRAASRRNERSRSRDREGKWVQDFDRRTDRPSAPQNEEGRGTWQDERGRPTYPSRRHDDGIPSDYRNVDRNRVSSRGRYNERGRHNRGRGRRFSGQGYRSYEMSGPGYYRIGEEAPERYDPTGDAIEHRPELVDRWEKVDLDAEEKSATQQLNRPNEEPSTRMGAYVAEYGAHAALQRTKGSFRDRNKDLIASPLPHTPNSIKRSPSQPRRYRRAADYRSETPSPLSSDETHKKDPFHDEKPAECVSNVPKKASSKDPANGPARKPERTAKSTSSRESKSRSQSSSMSSSPSRRSDRGRGRDRSRERHHTISSRRNYDDHSRYQNRRGRPGGRWRQMDFHRGSNYRGYRGHRRSGYGYNPPGHSSWRSDRRYARRSRSRSRSIERKRRRSFSRSSSSSGDRKPRVKDQTSSRSKSSKTNPESDSGSNRDASRSRSISKA